ncbi:MAG TPA: N-acetylmuramoyl-L-alanine amidase, partial [Ktedonobacteraceae bacterium]|nr:N-acetylmuramoyl-L-alanine amidase [Ktedonobacteraceae bacterium]
MRPGLSFSRLALLAVFTLAMLLTSFMSSMARVNAQATSTTQIGSAFEQASSEFGVPAPLLKAICYMEGRLSNHGGSPSVDHGFGCMHLIQNQRGDTLDQAASILGVSTDQLKTDIATNILGGAAVLHAEAEQLSSTHTLP